MINILSNSSFNSTFEDWKTEVGDIKQETFYPQIKIMKWDNEVNFSMRLLDDNSGVSCLDGTKIKYIKEDIETHFYELDEGFEFEIILKEKPKSNVLNFTLQHKGLDFYFQPEITDEEAQEDLDSLQSVKEDPTVSEEIKATLPNTIEEAKRYIRPDKVVNSYAVYHNSKANNKYKTGKAFHLYRPLAIDSKGRKTWCDINLNPEENTANIAIPQEFLDKAVYPISIDPDFGYTAIAGSSFNVSNAWCGANVYSGYIYAASTGDTIKSFSWYGMQYSSLRTIDVAVYSMPSGTIDGGSRLATAETFEVTTTSFTWVSVDTDQEMSNGVTYAVAFGRPSGTVRGKYDTVNGIPDSRYTGGSPPGYWLPATWSESSTQDRRYTVYATYEESAPPPSTIVKDLIYSGIIPSPR